MIHTGDSVEVMRTLPDASVDAVVTDPPYGLEFMGKEWDGANGFRRSLNGNDVGRESVHGRMSAKAPEYRGAKLMQAWHEQWATEAFRVLKPGGYLLAFGGTRTVHRLASAIEDAGFEIRDELVWIYASGFPKSLNLTGDRQGWGTALKPAHEPIVMARKPLIGTVSANVQKFGTGAINIDGTRIGYQSEADREGAAALQALRTKHPGGAPTYGGGKGMPPPTETGVNGSGRWPSNVLLQDPELFDQSNPYVVGSGATTTSSEWPERARDGHNAYVLPEGTIHDAYMGGGYGDSGGYSRFFLLSTRDNGSCASCGRAISADSPSYRPSPSADSAPSDAPTLPAGTQDSMGLEDGRTTEPGTRNSGPSSKPEASPTTTSQPQIDASSAEKLDEWTGTTTTTPSRLMCASCVADAMHGSTQPPQKPTALELTPAALHEYPVALIVPKADRAEREPVLRGQLTNGKVGGRNRADGRQWDIPGSTVANGKPDRGNTHPTVKPVDLMRHLVRLVTPPGGTVLDPFLGSGTTAIACELEGFGWIGIEKEPEYVAIAEARLNGTQRGLGI